MAALYIRWHIVALISGLVLFTIGVLYFLPNYVSIDTASETNVMKHASESLNSKSDEIHLATVSCGQPGFSGNMDYEKPLTLSMTMMKSAALFATKVLNLHIFTEDEMKPMFKEQIELWPSSVRSRINVLLYATDYSEILPREMVDEWKIWYKPCGSFRLFLPMILATRTDSAIYSDNDVIFIKPIDELWQHLKEMNEQQVAAIAPTTGHALSAGEDNVNLIPDPSGNIQINSGVMVMNFTRMRNANWRIPEMPLPGKYGVELLLAYYKKFKDTAEHDQKLLNIMYHYNPELLYKLPCSWNFKNNFCTSDDNKCDAAERNGAGAVHGISGSFFGNSNPTFKGLYETFAKYKLGDDVNKRLYKRYMAYLGAYAFQTYCGKKSRIIVNTLKKSLSKVSFHHEKSKE